jgi:sulfate transport system ATP-binding protein/LacI family transcriptional regulator/LacI family repressor for deo operon, udp, cdd, tsx, nupC, and nupG
MSIKKIAELAGTSTATVSRILNDPDYRCRSYELQNKIWSIAQELNYVPNEAARMLKKGSAETEERMYHISVLFVRTGESETDPFFVEMLRLLSAELMKKGCVVANIWYMPNLANDSSASSAEINKDLEKICAQSRGKNDGLVMLGKSKPQVMKAMSEKFKATIAILRNSPSFMQDEIFCNGERVGKCAVEYLYALGHRKIAYVGDCRTDICFKGYLEAIKELDIAYDVNYIIEARRKAEDGYEAMKYIMSLKNGPTAIYCPCDFVAISMLNALKKYRKRYYTPSIIASDGIEQSKYSKPMLTSVELPKDIMVKYAAYLLLDRLNNGHTDITRMEVESRLMIRESCTSFEEGTMFNYCI